MSHHYLQPPVRGNRCTICRLMLNALGQCEQHAGLGQQGRPAPNYPRPPTLQDVLDARDELRQAREDGSRWQDYLQDKYRQIGAAYAQGHPDEELPQ